MADSGRITSRQIARDLLTDVQDFRSDAMQEIDRISANAEVLGTSWKDEQYRQFHDYIEQLTQSLKTDLSVIEDAIQALEKEL